MNRPLLGSILLASAIALASLSCGPNTNDVAQPPGSAGVSPAKGGELRVNMEQKPETIDPNLSNFTRSTLVAS